MISSPVIGFLLGVFIMGLLFFLIAWLGRRQGWLGRLARPRWVNAFFGKAQLASAAYMGFAHGLNDAQKTMGLIALAIVGAHSVGQLDNLPSYLDFLRPNDDGIDTWIKVTCALVMAAGTAAGGWKIIKTLGHKMVKLHPVHGFAAETASAFCGGNCLGDDSLRRRHVGDAGIHHAQHFDRDHGGWLCEEFPCPEMECDRADSLGLDSDPASHWPDGLPAGLRAERVWRALSGMGSWYGSGGFLVRKRRQPEAAALLTV